MIAIFFRLHIDHPSGNMTLMFWIDQIYVLILQNTMHLR